ncbi:MAG: hypothetical protein JO332_00595 [Planctomycetaceae bacterium]|nr:hypothetical protein [Planctomycetaceae bacterium]
MVSLRLYALDLARFRGMLGSGEEKFCASVLRTVPAAAERRGLASDPDLVKEWKRGISGLVLGDAGEALSLRLPFEKTDLTKAPPAQSLAFASLVEGFAQGGLGGSLPISERIREELLSRPLFGLEPDGRLVRWGGLGRDQLKDLAAHPLIAPIRSRGLDVVSLSGKFWTD